MIQSTEPNQEKQIKRNLPLPNWVNQQTWTFISSLSFKGYILAGNSVTNMVQGIPLQGDLDFWSSDRSAYMKAFEQIAQHYDVFCIYPSMIQMHSKNSKLPKINLVFTNLTHMQTIQRFDFDYCRCYWMPNTDVVFGTGCQESIRTKLIKHIREQYRVMLKRILKALNYGYVFNQNFWRIYQYLLSNQRLKEILVNPNKRQYTAAFPVRIEDLDMSKFMLKKTSFKISNITNVSQTLKELGKQFQNLAQKTQLKLPVLLTLKKNQIKLVTEYIKSIIFQNPLSDSHYMEIRIGTKFICYGNNRYRNQQEAQMEDEEDSESSTYQYEKKQKKQEDKQEQEQIYSLKNQKKSDISNFPENIDVNSTIICDNFESKTIILNQDGSALIDISFLPLDIANEGFKSFDQMWKQCPQQKHKIIMHEKEVEVSRFSKSYLQTPNNLKHTATRSYMYSGFDTSKNNEKLPYIFNSFYYFMKREDNRYNQVIVNWYRNEEDFIAPHSDCQRGMVENSKISLISLYPQHDSEQFRYLQIIPKKNIKAVHEKVTIRLDHGMIITMQGRTQEDFLHGIRKQNKPCLPRISLSFRQMSQQ